MESTGGIDNMIENKKKSGTFVIHVHNSQNDTWQGEVIWADKNEKKHFRSALELMKLIDSALNQDTE